MKSFRRWFSRFITDDRKHEYVRRYIVLFLVGVVFFILPLQVFIIGDYAGIGIQGATYRYQVSAYGTSLIPVTRDLTFVFSGIYSGRTALSNILWALGTALLSCTMIYALIYARETNKDYFHQITLGLVGSCCIYLASCMAQYGFFFKGLAGISLPAGILMILAWIGILYLFRKFSGQTQPSG